MMCQRDALSESLLKALKEETLSSFFLSTQCIEVLNSGSSQELMRLVDLEIMAQPTSRLELSNKTASREKELVTSPASHALRGFSTVLEPHVVDTAAFPT